MLGRGIRVAGERSIVESSSSYLGNIIFVGAMFWRDFSKLQANLVCPSYWLGYEKIDPRQAGSEHQNPTVGSALLCFAAAAGSVNLMRFLVGTADPATTLCGGKNAFQYALLHNRAESIGFLQAHESFKSYAELQNLHEPVRSSYLGNDFGVADAKKSPLEINPCNPEHPVERLLRLARASFLTYSERELFSEPFRYGIWNDGIAFFTRTP